MRRHPDDQRWLDAIEKAYEAKKEELDAMRGAFYIGRKVDVKHHSGTTTHGIVIWVDPKKPRIKVRSELTGRDYFVSAYRIVI